MGCTNIQCALPANHEGACLDLEGLRQQLLKKAQEKQADYFDAVEKLQKALGVEVDETQDLADTDIDALLDKPEYAPTPGFAIKILPDTDLGTGVLIVEYKNRMYEPVNFASTINEAFGMANDDLRLRQMPAAGTALWPPVYNFWARGLEGHMIVAATWSVGELQPKNDPTP